MEKALSIWNKYQSDADWEVYDWHDHYTAECNILLEVEGYTFSGWGFMTCGEKEISELYCTTPEGKNIQIL